MAYNVYYVKLNIVNIIIHSLYSPCLIFFSQTVLVITDEVFAISKGVKFHTALLNENVYLFIFVDK